MDNKPKKNTKKYIISFLVLLILMALTFYIIFREFDFYEIIRQIYSSSHKGYLLFAGAGAVLYLAFYGVFTKTGISAFGQKISFFKSFVYGCADYFYAVITPSAGGGQPAVIYFMKKDGIPYSTAGAVVILQTITYKSVLLLYSILSVIFIPKVIIEAGTAFQICFVIGFIISVTATSICIISMYRTRFVGIAGTAIIRFLSKIRIFRNADNKIEAFNRELEEYRDAATYIKGRKKILVRMFGASFLQRTSLFIIAFFVYKSFGLSGLDFVYFLCIQAAVEIAVEVFPIPGSMGINEAATYLLFGSIYGTDKILTAAAMLLTRGFSYYLPLILSSIVIFCKHFYINMTAKKQLSNSDSQH